MSGFTYKRFLTVDLKHEFYRSGFTKDISITPTEETIQKMRNWRMLYRLTPKGCRVVYRAVSKLDPTPELAPENGLFTFVLGLNNVTEFLNFTDLDVSPSDKFKAGRIVHFYNSVTTTNALAYELLDGLVPAKFTYDFKFAVPPGGAVTLRIKKGITTVYTSPTLVADAQGVYHAPVDLAALAPGKFTFEHLDAGVSAAQQILYVDTKLAGKNIFGILDIEYKVDNIFTFTSFVALTAVNPYPVQFVLRESTWKYFIVNKNTTQRNFATPANFTITDTDTYPLTGTPYALSAYTFSSPPVAGPTINGNASLVFTSNVPIPFFETAKKKFVLKEGTTVLVPDLPNPKLDSISADPTDFSITNIFVYV
jgi:hypothetical protein